MNSIYIKLLTAEEISTVEAGTDKKTYNTILKRGCNRNAYLRRFFDAELVVFATYADYEDLKKLGREKVYKRLYQRCRVDKNKDKMRSYMRDYNRAQYNEDGTWKEKRESTQKLYLTKKRLDKRIKRLEALQHHKQAIEKNEAVILKEIQHFKEMLEILQG